MSEMSNRVPVSFEEVERAWDINNGRFLITYRRADGELVDGEFAFVADIEFFEGGDEIEVVEEEWQLKRSRTRVLGDRRLCRLCEGEQVFPCENCDGTNEHTCVLDGVEYGPLPCERCGGTGEEPRDEDPPWTS